MEDEIWQYEMGREFVFIRVIPRVYGDTHNDTTYIHSKLQQLSIDIEQF
jgi:hypothetical protein